MPGRDYHEASSEIDRLMRGVAAKRAEMDPTGDATADFLRAFDAYHEESSRPPIDRIQRTRRKGDRLPDGTHGNEQD